jgi:hypothetical protein
MPSTANSQRRAATIFAALALLVLPLCTRICGSPDCAIAPALHAENCDSSMAPGDGAPQSAVASIHACGLQQLPSAMPNKR